MIVYGDHVETIATRAYLQELEERRRVIAVMPPGVGRHTALVTLFIAVACLTQGVADGEFEAAGSDVRGAGEQSCLRVLMSLARSVIISWDSGMAELPALPELTITATLPPRLKLKLPEGYAFYALYPEAYFLAARTLQLPPPHIVIGLRSIGTGLAALVAAALDAALPWTLRPTGHPFARTLALAPERAAELVRHDASYVIVDEGPGLSGSSFGAVADLLEAGGVPRSRIAFLPGHGGALGPHASAAHRQRWAEVARPVVTTDALLLPQPLQHWIEAQIGPLDGPLEDISGGAWRARTWADERSWPAVDPGQERRKFIVQAEGARWLVKFAGLGIVGERKLARARALHAAGLVAAPVGLIHGFLVEQWADALPVSVQSGDLIPFVARHLATIARLFPAGAGSGADMHRLFEMARYNSEVALGTAAAASWDGWFGQLDMLAARASPVAIDGKCEAHEWLRTGAGRLLKADALDHHAGHDLIGCQDIAWDVAGAIVELGLGACEAEALIEQVEAGIGRPLDRLLLAYLTRCYLAFRLGQRWLSAAGLEGWPAEQARNLSAAEHYAGLLDRALSQSAADTSGASPPRAHLEATLR